MAVWMRSGDRPRTQYARSLDGINIAYQVLGDGPVDLIFLSGCFSHVDGRWELPQFARFLNELATFSRVLIFDKRGTGASDPVANIERVTIEDWVEDACTVMDAAGSKRAALYGTLEGGALATVLAATHPDRVSKLILANSGAKMIAAPDYPWGFPPAIEQQLLADIRKSWGAEEGIHAGLLGYTDPDVRAWFARYQRLCASPATAEAIWRVILSLDIRSVLPVLHVPTLVIHRAGCAPENGRFLADHIDGARYLEVEGDQWPVHAEPHEPFIAEVAEFVTGEPAPVASDRFLATVMFNDIVGSTDYASRVGDGEWRSTLSKYRSLVRRELKRFDGQEIDTHGDEFLAVFTKPSHAIQCARAIDLAVEGIGMSVRCGIHTGEVEKTAAGIEGIAVHIGARVISFAAPKEILVSRTVVDLVVGSLIEFDDRGDHDLKGIPGSWRLFAVRL